MKRSFFKLVTVGGLLTCLLARPAAGQEAQTNKENSTAYTALRLVGKTLGADAINRVVEVSGRDGKPQPTSWRIVLKEGEGTREVEVVNGRIEAQRPLTRASMLAPVKLPDLNLDSSGAFEATDAQARKTHVRFDSVNYSLRTSERTGKPLWTLELFNQEGTPAGTMRIAANNGAIVSMDGRVAADGPIPAKKPVAEERPAAKPPTATPRTAATPKPAPTAVVVDHPTPRRDLRPPATTTTTTTIVQTNSPAAVVDVPDADPTGPAAPPPPDDGGGFFTRTGRTLDHTSQAVTHSIDQAGRNVDHGVRRAGATVQRFFTGRSDLDGDSRPAPPPSDAQPD